MRPSYDGPGIYAIHIAGRLDTSWIDRLGGLTIVTIEEDEEGKQPETVLKGCLPDQASLLGVLNTLYNQRYPLLFVRYLNSC
ncbi:MAG: hypothetical protein KDJ65_37250 [Anaerolineae bacterium]|nr:hypothetical protein [Anaerolineae bacterium]